MSPPQRFLHIRHCCRPLRPRLLLAASLLLAALSSPAYASDCFQWAGHRFGINPSLLRAVALQESGINARAINRNQNGSYDVGVMQINSSWFPKLRRYGIQDKDLWDPCTNIMVGAWILSSNIQQMGPTLNALGAYNAKDPQRRLVYARQVLKRWDRLKMAAAAPDASLTRE